MILDMSKFRFMIYQNKRIKIWSFSKRKNPLVSSLLRVNFESHLAVLRFFRCIVLR
jgi:hypothetical protein